MSVFLSYKLSSQYIHHNPYMKLQYIIFHNKDLLCCLSEGEYLLVSIAVENWILILILELCEISYNIKVTLS